MTAILETQQMQISGRSVRFVRQGSGLPLVLLHGYPDNLQIFSRLVPLLAAEHDVIAFDWPGMGDSDPWPGGATFLNLAERLRILLDAWSIDRAVLVGTDMGAQPAIAFAAEHVERTAGLVVMNALISPDRPTSLDIRLLRKFGVNRFAIERFPGVVFARAHRTFVPASEPLPKEVRAELWRTFRQPAVRRFIVRLCAGYEGLWPRLWMTMPKVKAPTLALWAERDAHFPLAQAQALVERISGATLEVIPRGEHWMVWHRAEEVAERIIARSFATRGSL